MLWDCCPLEDLSHRQCASYRTVSPGLRESPRFLAAGGLWVRDGCGLARAGSRMLQATCQCDGCVEFFAWLTIGTSAEVLIPPSMTHYKLGKEVRIAECLLFVWWRRISISSSRHRNVLKADAQQVLAHSALPRKAPFTQRLKGTSPKKLQVSDCWPNEHTTATGYSLPVGA